MADMDITTDSGRQGRVRTAGGAGQRSGAGRRRAAAALGSLVLAVALVAAHGEAGAAEAAAAPKGFTYDLGLSLGFTSIDIDNAHFGLGIGGLQTQDPKAEYVFMEDVSRVEGYVAPRANATWETGRFGTFLAGLRGVGAATRGDGDPWFLTNNDPNAVLVDNCYGAWKSGDLIPALGKDGLEVSIGRQNFQLGDGMVLVDGNDEANRNGAIYWLDPALGWEMAGVLRLKAAPVRLELFALNANRDSGDDTILGGNLELANDKVGTLGTSYFALPSSDIEARDGMSVANVHGRVFPFYRFVPFPMLELAGEWNLQKNDDPKIDARAWYAEVIARLYMLPWYPALGYRYTSFSGDDAGTAGENEGWDPLHYGATAKGFGYWYQGIVVGTYEGRPTNLDTHFVNLTLAPVVKDMLPVIWMKALYYDHRFNDTSTARLDGGAVTSDRFATEWDLMAGYSPSKAVDYMVIYGRAKPGKGGTDRTYGADDNERLLQFAVLVHF
jgi:hypothetical protein